MSLIPNFAASAWSGLWFSRKYRIYREIPGDFFFLHFVKFGFNIGYRGCLFRIWRFPLDPNYGFRKNTESTGKFRVNCFFHFLQYGFNVVFRGCRFRILRFKLEPDNSFSKIAKISNLPVNSVRNIFSAFL